MADDIRALLRTKRQDLETQLAELSRPVGELGGISFGKRVGEGTNQAVERLSAVSAYDRLRATLDEVVRAEQKLDDGTYGRCDVCGDPIGDARLEVRPWATRCVADAAR